MAKAYSFSCDRCKKRMSTDSHAELIQFMNSHRDPCIRRFLSKPENSNYKKYYKQFLLNESKMKKATRSGCELPYIRILTHSEKVGNQSGHSR